MWNRTGTMWYNTTVPNLYNNTADSEPVSYNWPSLFLFVIVFLAISGNILVCLAVKLESKLHNMFNYFLVSLACSDMLSATIVMPVSIMNAFLGKLPMPMLLCVTWYSLDVFSTSSTIIHLCMISVDRYMSLKYPLKYGHAKKHCHTVLKICAVWILSFAIAGPLFLLSMFDKQRQVTYKGCGPETPVFVISSTVTSFYLPLMIMAIMYILTVKALHSQLKSQEKLTLVKTWSNATNNDRNTRRWRYNNTWRSDRLAEDHTTSFIGNDDREEHIISDTNTTSVCECHEYSNQDHSIEQRWPCINTSTVRPEDSELEDVNFLSTQTSRASENSMLKSNDSKELAQLGNQRKSWALEKCLKCSPVLSLTKQDAYRQRSLPTRPTAKLYTRKRKWTTIEKTGVNIAVQRANKGRRAVLVLGMLFGVFVTFYLPFFVTYVIYGTCLACQKSIPWQLLMVFEWLAYTGSMVNPFIYHIFNPDFRHAFRKILRCQFTNFHSR